MLDIPNIRVVTLAKALAEIEPLFEDPNKRSHPLVVARRDIHEGKDSDVPLTLFERLPDDFRGDLFIALTSVAELQAAGIGIGRHRQEFLAGEFVLVTIFKIHETPERDVGGQVVFGIEERARNGLYATVALATERMRACADRREGRKMKTDTRRNEIFERFKPLLPGLSAVNLFRQGQMLMDNWYAGMTAHEAMKSVYETIANMPGARAGRVNFAAIEAEQLDLVRTAGEVYTKTPKLLEAQHEMSAMLRELMESDRFENATPAEQRDMRAKLVREQAPAQHQELAHDKQGGPLLPQLMRAAWSMEFNPAGTYANALTYKLELDCAVLLGRVERGHGAMLEPTHIGRLKRFVTLADEADRTGRNDPEIEAARWLRDLALRVKPRASWEEFFTTAEADGRKFWIAKTM